MIGSLKQKKIVYDEYRIESFLPYLALAFFGVHGESLGSEEPCRLGIFCEAEGVAMVRYVRGIKKVL